MVIVISFLFSCDLSFSEFELELFLTWWTKFTKKSYLYLNASSDTLSQTRGLIKEKITYSKINKVHKDHIGLALWNHFIFNTLHRYRAFSLYCQKSCKGHREFLSQRFQGLSTDRQTHTLYLKTRMTTSIRSEAHLPFVAWPTDRRTKYL